MSSLSLRDFRGYDAAQVTVGEGLTVVTGPNGAGKTNLLEGLYFGCTGRSCRTNNERELIRFGASAARAVVSLQGDDGPHQLSVGFSPGQPKRMRVDGAPVERLLDVELRPLLSVFLPDRLELVKGPPALRRAHLDQFVCGLWPARAATRRAYAQSLAQRNALIVRVRSESGSATSLSSWDMQLARHGVALMSDRRTAVEVVADSFSALAAALGLGDEISLRYRPCSRAAEPEQLAAELAERIDSDLERGFTGYGPHRDELVLLRERHDVRAYGSQGEQRLALLALLLAERDAIARQRGSPPVMLLDDVMSELDAGRRQALVELLRNCGGQTIITAAELGHVPGVAAGTDVRIAVRAGRVLEGSAA